VGVNIEMGLKEIACEDVDRAQSRAFVRKKMAVIIRKMMKKSG
jgi:hypothetical protein